MQNLHIMEFSFCFFVPQNNLAQLLKPVKSERKGRILVQCSRNVCYVFQKRVEFKEIRIYITHVVFFLM